MNSVFFYVSVMQFHSLFIGFIQLNLFVRSVSLWFLLDKRIDCVTLRHFIQPDVTQKLKISIYVNPNHYYE